MNKIVNLADYLPEDYIPGVTDCSEALRCAREALGPGDRIQFPSGELLFDGSLRFEDFGAIPVSENNP